MRAVVFITIAIAAGAAALIAVTQYADEVNNNPDTGLPAGEAAGAVDISDSAWVWVYTDLLNGERVEAPAGNRFVLSFDEDEERVRSTTDCNSLLGGFVKDGEVLSFGPLASTKMYCAGETLERVYAEQLALTSSYAIEGDTLRLNLNRDYGVMVFVRQIVN